MLDALRRRKRSWIITFLLGLIIIVFIAFYGGNQPRDPNLGDIAEVNGEPITRQQYGLHFQRTVDRYRQIFNVALTPDLIKTMNLKGLVLEELIERRLLLQEARKLGLTATDEELMRAIVQVPEFHDVNRRFNKERYLQVLRANRLVPAQFEEEQRENLTIQRLYDIVADAVHVSEAEARERYRFAQEKIALQFVRLKADDFLAGVQPTEEEIKSHYDRNQDSLREPLRVRVEYLGYPFERFSGEVSSKEIEDYYQQHRDSRFHSPRQVRARYILVRPDAADAKSKEAAKARAERVVREARSGKNFTELAKKESADPSAAQGGEIGWLRAGQLPAELEKPVFALSKGEVSEPIDSPAGLHIFKVEEIKPEKTQTLVEARPEIVRTLRLEKGKREAAVAADRARAKVVAGTEMAQVAQAEGIPLKTTPWFSAGDVLPEIGPVQDFYQKALALGIGDVSPVVEGANAYYLLRVKERKEPVLPPLEAVRGRIEKDLRQAKAREQMRQKANALLQQLQTEKDIVKLARQHDLKVEETGWFVRSAPEIPKIGALQELMGSGLALSEQKPIADRVFTQNGTALLVALKDRQSANLEEFERQKQAFINQAVAEARQRALQKYKEALKAKGAIEIFVGSLEEL